MLTPITLTTTLCASSPAHISPSQSTFTAAEQSPPVTTVSLLRPDANPSPLSASQASSPSSPLSKLSPNVSSSPPSCTGGAKKQAAEESKLDLKCFPRALSRATGAQPLSEGEVPCRAHCRTAQRAKRGTLHQSSKFRALLECSRTGGGRQPAGPGAPSSSFSSSSSSSFSSHLILLGHQPSHCSSKPSTLPKSDWTSLSYVLFSRK